MTRSGDKKYKKCLDNSQKNFVKVIGIQHNWNQIQNWKIIIYNKSVHFCSILDIFPKFLWFPDEKERILTKMFKIKICSESNFLQFPIFKFFYNQSWWKSILGLFLREQTISIQTRSLFWAIDQWVSEYVQLGAISKHAVHSQIWSLYFSSHYFLLGVWCLA